MHVKPAKQTAVETGWSWNRSNYISRENRKKTIRNVSETTQNTLQEHQNPIKNTIKPKPHKKKRDPKIQHPQSYRWGGGPGPVSSLHFHTCASEAAKMAAERFSWPKDSVGALDFPRARSRHLGNSKKNVFKKLFQKHPTKMPKKNSIN